MYELFIALKYLIPKKRAFSTSVISLIAFVVISLVVWLSLVFLSVTSGLEYNWLKKLTSINAPIRITPTDDYYQSYYYLIDTLSSDSFYETKTIGEKKTAKLTDPYLQDSDMEIPYHWKKPDLNDEGKLKDPVQIAYQKLDSLKKEYSSLKFQDYEASGAFMRLTLNRGSLDTYTKTSFISQMTYIMSLSEVNPNMSELLIAPTIEDVSSLLVKQQMQTLKDRENFLSTNTTFNDSVLKNIKIKKVKLKDGLPLPFYLLADNVSFYVKDQSQNDHPKQFVLLNGAISKTQIVKNKNKIQYVVDKKIVDSFDANAASIYLNEPLVFDVYSSDDQGKTLFIKGAVQNEKMQGKIALSQCQIMDVDAFTHFKEDPTTSPPWVYFVENKGYILPSLNHNFGILLPRSFKKNHVLIGDVGYFGYSSASSTSSKEMRVPFYVAGFYDPGVFPLGNRFIIAPIDLIRIINSSSYVSTNEISNNGIFVWKSPLKDAKKIKSELQAEFIDQKIDKYWNVETYEDFEFSKDLMQQFQSDKLLFSLVAVIILMVACSNVISMLILLVNDKKKEIAIMMSIGATKKSIALIFAICGFITGFFSTALGILLAIITLKNIDLIAAFLSSIQGHQAFNAAFFGSSLPNTLSSDALLFIMIITPIISLLAGVIPAIKAAKLSPSKTLRS